MDHPEHIVIGGGVVGAAAARSLAARGRRVLLVEQFARGHDRGSSHGASRIFRQGYTAPEYVAMTSRALELWRTLESESGEQLLTLTGAVDHGRPETVDAITDALAAAGIPAERLTPDEATARWPGLVFEGSVLTHASAGRIRSDRAVEALLDRAAADGAELWFETPVSGVVVDADGATVTLADGRSVTTPSVVVAVGSWTHPLVGAVLDARGAALPEVRVTEEQPAHFRTTLPDEAWPSVVHYPLDVAGTGGSDSVYGLCTPGQGVKVGFHGTGTEVSADHRTSAPDAAQLAALVAYVERFVPGVSVADPEPISCLYDTTPDEDFVLDRSGPVTVATGFSGHGFKFAPLLGDVLADLAMLPADAAPGAPVRSLPGRARERFAFRS
ncbi:FAD-dependent oxidoreductase [Curtobacterium sp. RRHDQ10]|uniref:FAD-dependent oxidoreductase n=1 Tax=Curtobacterium phyllosphaerae TaxID=3413379 RepID=UPI003BF2919B